MTFKQFKKELKYFFTSCGETRYQAKQALTWMRREIQRERANHKIRMSSDFGDYLERVSASGFNRDTAFYSSH